MIPRCFAAFAVLYFLERFSYCRLASQNIQEFKLKAKEFEFQKSFFFSCTVKDIWLKLLKKYQIKQL